jgi:hypothetical protein
VITSNNNVPSWIATNSANAYQAVYDPDVLRLEAAGVDNNWLYQGTTASSASNSAKQNLSTPLADNTKYVLSVMTGFDTSTSYGYPAVGNGVSTGNVFARLLVDTSIAQDGSSLVAMPGFVAGLSSTPAPASHGSIVNWTLTWQTGPGEALAGDAIWVQLAMNASVANDEVYWDNVSLVTSVPEPSAALLVSAILGATLLRRRRAA